MTQSIECSRCGRNARYNHPSHDKDGKLVCEACADADISGDLLIGLDQQTLTPCGVYTRNRCVIWREEGTNTRAWTRSGGLVFPMDENEKHMSVEKLFDIMDDEHSRGVWRCTTCERKMSSGDKRFDKRFAGQECSECHKQTLVAEKRERENGDICRKCGKPYSRCYC